jgi:endonuclease/exonuclease/phosphatase (EEP) superfamily protein YafD
VTGMTRARLLRGADALLWLGSLGCLLVLVATIVAPWPLSLLEHFRVQHVAIGIAVTGACTVRRHGRWLARVDVALLATLLHLVWLIPDLGAARRPIPAGSDLRVMLLNVRTSSTAHEAVRRLVEDVDADLVALIETDERWLEALAPALASYPSRIEHPQRAFGIAVYARGALTAQVRHLGVHPSIVGSFQHDGRQISIVVTHPIPPVARALVTDHETQLAAVAAHARSLPSPTLMLGDFNATPWSRAFRDVIGVSGLCDTRAGFGLHATFPAGSILRRIPLDHVLASCAIGVRDRYIERDVGSDHLPVVVDLVVP